MIISKQQAKRKSRIRSKKPKPMWWFLQIECDCCHKIFIDQISNNELQTYENKKEYFCCRKCREKAKRGNLPSGLRLAGTYQIINKLNKKIYNGSTSNMKFRFYSHKYNLKRNKDSELLQKDWNKYGSDVFTTIINKEIAYVWDWKKWSKQQKLLLEESLLYWEQLRIDEDESYKPEKGYNIFKNAGSFPKGRETPDSVKQKMRKPHCKRIVKKCKKLR